MYFQKVALDFSILQSRCLYFSSEIGLLPLSTENTSQEGLWWLVRSEEAPSQCMFFYHFPCLSSCWPHSQTFRGSLMPKGKSYGILARHSMSSLSCCILPFQSLNTTYWLGHPPAGPIDLCVSNLPGMSSWKTHHFPSGVIWESKAPFASSLLSSSYTQRCTMPMSPSVINHLVISTARF